MRLLAIFLIAALRLAEGQSTSDKHVHSVYVAELHFRTNPDLDGIVRSKLISSLAERCGPACTVKEAVAGDGDVADAVLMGDMVIQTPDSRHYRVQGAMRLVDKDGNVLWAATVYNSPLARSATSSFADNVAKRVASFFAEHDKARQ